MTAHLECVFCGETVDASKDSKAPCMFAWWTEKEPGSSVFKVGLYCAGRDHCLGAAERCGHLLDANADRWSWDHVDRVLRGYPWTTNSRIELIALSIDVLGTAPPPSLAGTKPAFSTDGCGIKDWTTPTDRRIEHISSQRAPLATGEADAAVLVYERLLTARIMANELFGSEGTDAHLVMRIVDSIAAAKKERQ